MQRFLTRVSDLLTRGIFCSSSPETLLNQIVLPPHCNKHPGFSLVHSKQVYSKMISHNNRKAQLEDCAGNKSEKRTKG